MNKESSILIVDDDQSICRTLTAILEAEGFHTTTANTSRQALLRTAETDYDVALVDIRLPDVDGNKLLAELQKASPHMIKIILTGYPSLENAVDALRLGADSYLTKPINPAELVQTLRDKLDTRFKEERRTAESFERWFEEQKRHVRSRDFQKTLEEQSTRLAEFGLTGNQSKIYITVLALGVASVSEVADASGIRREETYRLISEIADHGLIIQKLGVPKRFSAIDPQIAVQLLTEAKFRRMKEEVEKLKQHEVELVSRLKSIRLAPNEADSSVEILRKAENVSLKLLEMTESARHEIDLVTSLRELRTAYMNRSAKSRKKLLQKIKMKIIVEKEYDGFINDVSGIAKSYGNQVEVRFLERIRFNLMLVDGKQAMWGESMAHESKNKTPGPSYWTDEPTQIDILKASFEKLWEEAAMNN